MIRPAPRSAGLSHLVAATIVTVTIVAGCGTTASPTAPTVASSPAASTSPTDSPPSLSPGAASPSTSPTAPSIGPSNIPSIEVPSQTETDWGLIWDELPGSFPVFPGQMPTETGEGPFTAQVAIPADAAAAATWYQAALETVGFSTESMSGPLEDGGWVVVSTGDPEGCQAETRLRPHGDGTLVSVLLGAECPFS